MTNEKQESSAGTVLAVLAIIALALALWYLYHQMQALQTENVSLREGLNRARTAEIERQGDHGRVSGVY